jgi:group I intron endonuclease
MIAIYKITNKINRKSYVGQTNDFNRRMYEHFNKKHKGNATLKRAITKYGKGNFEIIVLEELNTNDRRFLNEREMYYIKLYQPEYNRTKGGSGQKGMFVSDETKEKLRIAAKLQWERKTEEERNTIIKNNLKGPKLNHNVSEVTREKLRQHNLGKKQSKETVEKRKQSQQETWKKNGGKNANNHKKKVRIVELDMIFQSLKDCAEYIGCRPTSVSSVLKERQKTVRGYHIEYVV